MTQTDISPDHTNIGWIGTGIMGAPMAGHLIKAGYQLFVYNRSPAKAQTLLESGATWCDTPAQVAEQTDVIFTMLGHPADVDQVYFGQQGLVHKLQSGAIVIDMTTTRPKLARLISESCHVQGAFALDAPVSGGQIGAEQGKLSVMLGGDPDIAERIKPLLDNFSATVTYQGSAGAGQHTKMCNQIAVATTMVGVCEALVYGHRAGLDLTTLLGSISKGAAACWALDNLAPKIIAGDYEPGFMVDHLVKDLGIALNEAEMMQLDLPGLTLAKKLYDAVMEMGMESSGIQALYLALERLSSQP